MNVDQSFARFFSCGPYSHLKSTAHNLADLTAAQTTTNLGIRTSRDSIFGVRVQNDSIDLLLMTLEYILHLLLLRVEQNNRLVCASS